MLSGGKILDKDGEVELETPWEYACLRASRYTKSVKPWEWDRTETARDWLEYALMSESVENEIQAEELAKQNPKQARRAPLHHAVFNQDVQP